MLNHSRPQDRWHGAGTVTAMDPLSARPPLLSNALEGPLEQLILPQLSAADLGRLACTCSHMHQYLASVDIDIWREAATAVLPCVHPSLCTADLAAVRHALRVYQGSLQNMKADKHTRLWELPEATLHHISSSCGYLATLPPSPSGQHIAVLRVYNISLLEPEVLFEIPLLPIGNEAFRRVLWSADEQQMLIERTCGRKSHWTIHDARSGQEMSTFMSKSRTLASLSPSWDFIAALVWDQQISLSVTNVHTGHNITYENMAALETAWHPSEPFLAYTMLMGAGQSSMRQGCIHNCETGERFCPAVLEGLQPFRWSPDGQYLACWVQGNRAISIVNVSRQTAGPILDRVHHSIVFSPDSTLIAVRSYNQIHDAATIEVWDIASACRRHSFHSHLQVLCWSPDSAFLACRAHGAGHRLESVQICDARLGICVAEVMGQDGLRVSCMWLPAQSCIYVEVGTKVSCVSFAPHHI